MDRTITRGRALPHFRSEFESFVKLLESLVKHYGEKTWIRLSVEMSSNCHNTVMNGPYGVETSSHTA